MTNKERRCYTAGVPNLRTIDQCWSTACQEPGLTAGGERQASKRSFICRSPSLPTAPHCSRYHLNHPHTPPSVEKLPSTKLVPGAKKFGDCCYIGRSGMASFFLTKKCYFIYLFFIQQVLISYLFYAYQCIYVVPNLPVHPTTATLTPPTTFPPWCPQVCSLHLCLYLCLANWSICTIFLDSTYAR